jgi:hypothetical protein
VLAQGRAQHEIELVMKEAIAPLTRNDDWNENHDLSIPFVSRIFDERANWFDD